MLDQIKKIIEAWIISSNPNENQKILAEKRYEICVGCDQFRERRMVTSDQYCEKCGCPIKKKIFTSKFNECPLKKWEDVDKEYWGKTQKQNKSLL